MVKYREDGYLFSTAKIKKRMKSGIIKNIEGHKSDEKKK